MPVVTAGSKSLPLLHGHIFGHQWYCFRLAISVIITAIILTVIFLPRQTRKRQLPKPPTPSRVSPIRRQHVTCKPKTPCSSIKSNISSVSDCWVPLKQGQGHFEKRANRAVSRGEASGTAPVGLGGSREGGNMEEEERAISAESRSRGVSKNWSDSAGVSNASPSLAADQLLVTAEQSSHVGSYPGYDADEGPHEQQDNMGDAHGELVGVSAGSGSVVIQEARGRVSTAFGDYMVDDEHILYGARGSPLLQTASDSSKWSHSPWPLTPPASAAGISQGSTADEDHSRSIAIPSRAATGSHSTTGERMGWEGSGEPDRGAALYRSDEGSSSSSYPPTSPLLPPAPPTITTTTTTPAYEAFDPSAVMFPGPARDGGIRVVQPPHIHGRSEEGSSMPQVVGSSKADCPPGASWARHTRVYGGGVCLACAAAASAAGGEGGFYGDSVRPEDKRR